MSNQCSSCLLAYVKPRSYFRELEITRAAALSTFKTTTSSSAVATKADRTVYEVHYSSRTLFGIARDQREFTNSQFRSEVGLAVMRWPSG